MSHFIQGRVDDDELWEKFTLKLHKLKISKQEFLLNQIKGFVNKKKEVK